MSTEQGQSSQHEELPVLVVHITKSDLTYVVG